MMNNLDITVHERFIKNLKFLLNEKGISQNAFSKEIDKSVTHVNALINGRGTPTLEFVIKCSQYFNKSIDSLLFSDIGGE